jgi:hypothetical protein
MPLGLDKAAAKDWFHRFVVPLSTGSGAHAWGPTLANLDGMSVIRQKIGHDLVRTSSEMAQDQEAGQGGDAPGRCDGRNGGYAEDEAGVRGSCQRS